MARYVGKHRPDVTLGRIGQTDRIDLELGNVVK
jgi:hypothetical protein